MRIGLIVGTRPELIKTWSVIKEINSRESLELVLIHTGQHYDYEMSKVFFEDLSIEEPDFYLNVGSLPSVEQTTSVMTKLSGVFNEIDVDIVLVQGDTNSCMGSALATVQHGIPLGHIEAGCRSFDRTMPEEFNRLIIDSIANLLFAPSDIALHNLLREGHSSKRAVLVGNTAVDALNEGLRLLGTSEGQPEEPYAVATVHRAANTDNPERLEEILSALSQLPMKCVFPIHPRTQKRTEEFGLNEMLSSDKLEVISPMGYLSFLRLMRDASLVLTDSGGVQEEAALLGVPTITLRNNTEWPETVWTGINQLSHAKRDEIVRIASEVASDVRSEDWTLYKGNAGKAIVDLIEKRHGDGELRYEVPDMLSTGYPMLALVKGEDSAGLVKFGKTGKAVLKGKAVHSLLEVHEPLKKQ
ncbi:MAG: non-hydrolyzing UDP-N-acetylglucosamine 2-epimerase [Candidatus Thorarchaeota archaeon]|jgi:UDP-N-acetylglucosamine 2-epimerase (non-hydrolysing)